MLHTGPKKLAMRITSICDTGLKPPLPITKATTKRFAAITGHWVTNPLSLQSNLKRD